MRRLAVFIAALALVAGCAGPKPGQAGKIRFSLDAIDDRGLTGPPDGLRAVAYEFCIPRGESYTRQVMLIDPSVRFYPGSPGRIGCGPDQVLCVGSTGAPNWRGRLMQLAALEYVSEIRRSHFE